MARRFPTGIYTYLSIKENPFIAVHSSAKYIRDLTAKVLCYVPTSYRFMRQGSVHAGLYKLLQRHLSFSTEITFSKLFQCIPYILVNCGNFCILKFQTPSNSFPRIPQLHKQFFQNIFIKDTIHLLNDNKKFQGHQYIFFLCETMTQKALGKTLQLYLS